MLYTGTGLCAILVNSTKFPIFCDTICGFRSRKVAPDVALVVCNFSYTLELRQFKLKFV